MLTTTTLLHAIEIAPAARRWLAATRQARVLSVFERVCNLVNQHGDVLSITAGSPALTPFSLTIPASESGTILRIEPEHDVTVAAAILKVGNLRIDTEKCRTWESSPAWQMVRETFGDPGVERHLAAIVARLPAPPSLLDIFKAAGGGSRAAIDLHRRITDASDRLGHGLCTGSEADAVAGACRLAGLGSGLTPAGDDFILGALLAARAGLLGPGAEAVAPAVAAAVVPLTTTLSAAYVQAAARGECAAYWHALFSALQTGAGPATESAVRRMLLVGHSSGADALAGFLFCGRH
jgi:hypothetical protein